MSQQDVLDLKNAYTVNSQLASILSSLKNLREASTNVSAPFSEKVQASAKNKIEETVIDIVALEQDYVEKQHGLISMRRALKAKLDSLDGISQAILTEHYFNGEKWEDLAELHGYTERHLYNLNKKAIALLEML